VPRREQLSAANKRLLKVPIGEVRATPAASLKLEEVPVIAAASDTNVLLGLHHDRKPVEFLQEPSLHREDLIRGDPMAQLFFRAHVPRGSESTRLERLSLLI
jgi:hypothetical protein